MTYKCDTISNCPRILWTHSVDRTEYVCVPMSVCNHYLPNSLLSSSLDRATCGPSSKTTYQWIKTKKEKLKERKDSEKSEMYTLTIWWNMDKLRICYPQSLSQIFHYSSGSLSRWLFNKITTTQSLAWNTEAKCRHSRNVLLTVGCPFLCCGININNNDGLSCVYQSIHPSIARSSATVAGVNGS